MAVSFPSRKFCVNSAPPAPLKVISIPAERRSLVQTFRQLPEICVWGGPTSTLSAPFSSVTALSMPWNVQSTPAVVPTMWEMLRGLAEKGQCVLASFETRFYILISTAAPSVEKLCVNWAPAAPSKVISTVCEDGGGTGLALAVLARVADRANSPEYFILKILI